MVTKKTPLLQTDHQTSATKQLTLSACDAIADMLLSSVVERVQELVELILGLATERRQ